MTPKNGVFVVWKKFQRRVEVLAPHLDLRILYFHYPWEEKSKVLKALSYIPKTLATIKCLIQSKPSLIFVQFPPTPALYCVAFYSLITGSRYMADCHILTASSIWLKWIFAKRLLRGKMIVHNQHIVEHVIKNMDLEPLLVRDGIAGIYSPDIRRTTLLLGLGLSPKSYVIVPCSFASDEPLKEMIDAARLLPEVMFVMTWYSERLARTARNSLPPNILLTGYLEMDDFNFVFANAGVVLVLTNQEDVQLSGVQEAMTFEIPAVVTDLKTTRFLYRDAPVYVSNCPVSIADGVRYAFQHRTSLQSRMRSLRSKTEKEFFAQLASLKAILKSMG